MVRQEGTIFLKPKEKAAAPGLARKTGAKIVVPATKEVFQPSTKKFVPAKPSRTKGRTIVFSGTSSAQLEVARVAEVKRVAAEAARVAEAKRIAEIKRLVEVKRLSELKRIAEVKKKSEFLKQRIIKAKRFEAIKKSFNVVSLGVLTRSNIKKQEENLGKQIESFNKRFGKERLSEQEFNIAQLASSKLQKEQEKIDESKTKFEKSKLGKVRKFFIPFEEDPSFFKFDKAIKTKSEDLLKTKNKITALKGKTGVVANLNRKRLKSIEKGQEKAVRDLQSGKVPVLIKGTVPLTPVGTFPTSAKIVFVGKQRQVGGKIITDIAFKSGRKTIGVAKGVSVTKGKDSVSIVVGRTGVKVAKFPSAKITTVRRKSFIAVEKSRVRPSAPKIKQTIQLLRNKRKAGTISVIRSNLKALQQKSLGQIVTVKGDKIIRTGAKFPSGKLKKIKGRGLVLDSFASISSIFTKKDLSLIIGKTITARGNKAKFIGIIKGTSKVTTGKGGLVLNNIQKQQFKQALNKVISAASASTGKASKLRGLSKLGRVAASSGIATQTIRATQRTQQRPRQVMRVRQKPRQITRVKQTPRQALRVSQKARQGLRMAQTPAQIAKQVTGLSTKQAQRLSTKQLSTLKQALLAGTVTGFVTPTTIRTIPVGRIPKTKPGRVSQRKLSKSTQTFDVFGKSGKRFLKLNKKPLTRDDALSKGSFAVDRTTSRTFKMVPVGKRLIVEKLPKTQKNYFKRQGFKFRDVKIKRGRKLRLRKKFIERTKFAIDTKSEVQGLTIAKQLKQQRRPKGQVSKKVLNNLAKGRAIRMSNSKKSRK